jgi:trimethylamine:corrinoid methyltransferase-like protein
VGAAQLLTSAGAGVEDGVAHIPEPLARRALQSAPREFWLYDRASQPAVHYGGDDVHFDPGSSCLNVLDPDALRPRLPQTADPVRLIQVTEMLAQYAAQSTAVVCNDIPPGDWRFLSTVPGLVVFQQAGCDRRVQRGHVAGDDRSARRCRASRARAFTWYLTKCTGELFQLAHGVG